MGLKLSISNIAWGPEHDEEMYQYLADFGFQGLEIAPTRVFSERPYEKFEEAQEWAKQINSKYGLEVCSLQSIWYGRQEKIFGEEGERNALIDYTKQAIIFAEAVGAHNLVFGCPKNRISDSKADFDLAIEFFRTLGDYAAAHNTVIAMEANPVIYGTNFINTTREAIELIRRVGSNGFKLNLDLGTIIYNEENFSDIADDLGLVNHVHISEPNLKFIEKRKVHRNLLQKLKSISYQRYISIEMGKREDISEVFNSIKYIAALRGNINEK